VRRCDKPNFAPYKCAATLRGEDREGWIDTGIQLTGFDPHVYLSFAAVKTAAHLVGFADPAPLHDRIAELERENADLQLQLREADKLVDAIDVFESAGFRARKKPGRPPSKAAA
jgi:hypothetical protein